MHLFNSQYKRSNEPLITLHGVLILTSLPVHRSQSTSVVAGSCTVSCSCSTPADTRDTAWAQPNTASDVTLTPSYLSCRCCCRGRAGASTSGVGRVYKGRRHVETVPVTTKQPTDGGCGGGRGCIGDVIRTRSRWTVTYGCDWGVDWGRTIERGCGYATAGQRLATVATVTRQRAISASAGSRVTRRSVETRGIGTTEPPTVAGGGGADDLDGCEWCTPRAGTGGIVYAHLQR